MKTLRAAFRLAVVGIGSIGYLTKIRFTKNAEKSDKTFKNWMNFLAKSLNVTVNTYGENAGTKDQQVLYLPNHVSASDAIVLGNSIRTSFVAAEETANWPVVGPISKLRNTVFIERISGRLTDEEKQAVVERVCNKVKATMDKGHNVTIFPEGTMTDGSRILKFRPSVLSLLFRDENKQSNQIIAQPLAIEIDSINGQKVEKGKPSPLRDTFAHYTDPETGRSNKSLIGHIWGMAMADSININVHFMDPLNANDFEDHLDLAQTARQMLIDKLEAQDAVLVAAQKAQDAEAQAPKPENAPKANAPKPATM